MIVIELISVLISCCYIYSIRHHQLEALYFEQFSSFTLSGTVGNTDSHVHGFIKNFTESIAEETFEYVWATSETEYREGADESYKSAGTLEKDKIVRRTGITYNGWSRITIDGEDYYVPGDTLTADFPEDLPIAAGIKGEYQKYAFSLFPDFGWGISELEPLIYLWNRESGWNPNSHNKRSGAHGIPQALPGSKMASEGSDYYTNPEPQIRWGLKYIAGRYGSPSSAWAHFTSHGWY